jgi:hypothetical protein
MYCGGFKTENKTNFVKENHTILHVISMSPIKVRLCILNYNGFLKIFFESHVLKIIVR